MSMQSMTSTKRIVLGFKPITPKWRRAWNVNLCALIIFGSVVLLGWFTSLADATPMSQTSVTNTARFSANLDINIVESDWAEDVWVKDGGVAEQDVASIEEEAAFVERDKELDTSDAANVQRAYRAKLITPSSAVAKNPQAQNSSEIYAWVFITTQVPLIEARLSDGDRASTNELRECFDIDFNEDDWKLVSANRVNDEFDEITYGYRSIVSPNEITSPLFSNVKLANILDGDFAKAPEQSINVTAKGIQSYGLNNVNEAWDAFVNQLLRAEHSDDEVRML